MSATLHVTKLEPGTPEYQQAAAMALVASTDFTTQSFPRARPLRFWVEGFGGYSFTIETPDGTLHDVSLEPWRGEDQDATFVAIVVRYRDPSLIGTKGKGAPSGG